jgi:hypothetical protein
MTIDFSRIYFLDLKGLVNELKVKRSRSRENFAYCFAIVASFFLLRILGDGKAPVNSILAWAITCIVGIAISYYLLTELYNANGGDSGEYFLDRLLALGWVVGIRTLIVWIPLLIIINLSRRAGIISGGGVALAFIVLALGAFAYCFIATRESLREIRASEPGVGI